MLLLGIWLIVTGLLTALSIGNPVVQCFTGSACYRCRCFYRAGSVGCSVSAIMDMSTGPIMEIPFSFLAAADGTLGFIALTRCRISRFMGKEKLG